MNYRIYKLKFYGAVHFGSNSLDNSDFTFYADTLFSALCTEALKLGVGKLEELYRYVSDGKLLFSDALPYIQGTYFLPKPMCRIEASGSKGDSEIKKAYKRLKYIEADRLSEYMSGNYDVRMAADLNEELGHFNMKVSAAIRGEEQTLPYRVHTFSFNEGNGLYVITGYEDDIVLETAEELLMNISYAGIGGRRASGLGRFELVNAKIPDWFERMLMDEGDRYMTLSVSLPKDSELDSALDSAQYMLCRRSGFVYSELYSDSQMRKNDLYVLKAGACVHHKYSGYVADVSGNAGSHPVYRYAKPMFLKV